MGLTAGNAAGYRGGAISTGIEDFLVLPAVPVVPLLPGPALRDGFSHVLGLRIVVPEALRRPSGQLLRQRQPSPLQTLRRLFRQLLRQRQSLVVLSCSAGVLHKASCSNLVVTFTIGYGDQTLGGHCCFRRHLAELTFDTSGSKKVVTEILALRGGVLLLKEYFESSRLHKSPWRIYLALSLSTSWNCVLHHEIVHWHSKQTVSHSAREQAFRSRRSCRCRPQSGIGLHSLVAGVLPSNSTGTRSRARRPFSHECHSYSGGELSWPLQNAYFIRHSFQAEGIGSRALAVKRITVATIHGTHISEKSSRRFPRAGSMLCFRRGVSHEVDAQMLLCDRGCWSRGSDEDTSLQSCGDLSRFHRRQANQQGLVMSRSRQTVSTVRFVRRGHFSVVPMTDR